MNIYVVWDHLGSVRPDVKCFTSKKKAQKERDSREYWFLERCGGKINPDFDPDFVCDTYEEFVEKAKEKEEEDCVKLLVELAEAVLLLTKKN